jgi:hypothetical protein
LADADSESKSLSDSFAIAESASIADTFTKWIANAYCE